MRFIAITALFLSACNSGPPPEPPPAGTFVGSGEKLVAIDGKHEVTTEMMAAVNRMVSPAQIEADKNSGKYADYAENMAIGNLLWSEAVAAGLHKDPAIQQALAMKAREMLAQELIEVRVDERVGDAQLQAAYDKRSRDFVKPQARARHILVEKEDTAKEVLAKLEAGEDFKKLVQEYSIDARTKSTEGEFPWFARDKLLEEVAAVAFDAPLNKPVGPLQTRWGFHIIEPLERRDAVPLEEVRDELESDLRNTERARVIEEVRAKVKFERFGEVLEIHNKTDTWGVTPGMGKEGQH